MLNFQKTCRKMFLMILLTCTQACISNANSQEINHDSIPSMALEEGIFSPNDGNETAAFDLFRPKKCKKTVRLSYYLNISDFVQSFISIPTQNVSVDSTTISSSYLAGRAPIYNERNEQVGTCSASFLNMQNANGIFTDISNYLTVDNGLIVTWFTPSTLINLELDSIVNSMVTECIVVASTKVGFNPFYGDKFNMVVSSDNQKIYFKLTKL